MSEAPMANDILMVKKIWVSISHSVAYKYYSNINIQSLFFLNIIILKQWDWTNDDMRILKFIIPKIQTFDILKIIQGIG